MRRRWAVIGLILAGCAKHDAILTGGVPVKHDVDPWVLACYDPKATESALLWNGVVGLRLGRDGGPLGPDGNRLPMFTIDGYAKSGEEKIQPFSNPLPEAPTFEGTKPSLIGCSDYKQLLDMRTGVLTTSWVQPGPRGRMLGVTHSVVLHPFARLVADRWAFTINWRVGEPILPDFPDTDYISRNGPAGQPMTLISTSSFSLQGKDLFSAQLDRVAEILPGTGSGTGSGTGFGSGGVVGKRGIGGAPGAGRNAKASQVGGAEDSEDFDQIVADSKRVWAKRWETDIEIDGPVADQQAVRSFLFYLRSAISDQAIQNPSDLLIQNLSTPAIQNPKSKIQNRIGPKSKIQNPISPYGLSNATYNGHVFWDADIWVFPALALIDPQKAATIPAYRLARADQAAANYRNWVQKGKWASLMQVKSPSPEGGLMFPWESGASGAETMPGPSKFEHHITGSVAFAFKQAADLGLASESDAARIIKGANQFYESRSIPGPNGREIQRTLSPDENRVANNDLYTNLLAEWLREGGRWTGAKPTYKLPQDRHGFLTYDDDPMRSYQQAAAVLSIYPLEYPPALYDGASLMELYGNRVSKYGPAMSESVHAIIWTRYGDPARGYTAWLNSWQGFMQEPLGLFSERRAVSSTYFLTGAAGSLQSVLYGFLGIRIDSRNQPGSAWSKRLFGDRVLSIAPDLPPQWHSVKLKNFTVLGRRFTLTETHTHGGETATVTQGD